MRKALLAFAVLALAAGHGGGSASVPAAQAQALTTVTVEANLVAPFAGTLVVSSRVRRYASAIADPASARMPALHLAEASSWIEIRDAAGLLVCRSTAPAAIIDVDARDVLRARTSDPACPLDVEVAAVGDLRPFARPVIRGDSSSLATGYRRDAAAVGAQLMGEPAVLDQVVLTRTQTLTPAITP